MGKRLLLLGGGHAHMITLGNIQRLCSQGHEVTVVQPDEYHYYYHNLQASLNRNELKAFQPGGDYLLIYNLGDGTGIFSKGRLTFGGRPAFWLKDWIDRRFMKRFQALEL